MADDGLSAKTWSPWEDWGRLIAVTSVVLPAFGVAVRSAWLLPHGGVPFQAVVQVSIAQLAVDGLVAIAFPVALASLFAYGLGRLRPFVGPERAVTAAHDEAHQSYDAAVASRDRLFAQLDRLQQEATALGSARKATKAQMERLTKSLSEAKDAFAETQVGLARAEGAVKAAEDALHHPWLRLRLAIARHKTTWRILRLVAFATVLVSFLAAVLVSSPGTLVAIVAYEVLAFWLWHKSDLDGRVSFRAAVPVVLIVGLISSLAVGLDASVAPPVWVTFTASSPHPSGWYAQISDVQDTVYLLSCDGARTMVAPLATIAALDYPAARVSEIDNSLVHLIQTRNLPSVGLVTICPASDQPPLSKSPSG
jgi:hypothetical protein